MIPTRETFDGAARAVLATAIMLIVAVIMATLLQHEMPMTNRDAVMLGIGVLLALLKDVYGYYFSSTASGARKDIAIAAALTSATTPTPTKEETPP